jgi:hypothetical protein
MDKEKKILDTLKVKSNIKQKVFDNTLNSLKTIKEILQESEVYYNNELEKADNRVNVEFKDRGVFQAEFKVAGDLLVFYMHSNVFEFDRDHGIWKISYIQNNKMASYCGVINIYNFLNDSFRYERMDDLGYLVARIFINMDFYYFVEGKRQMGYLFNDFGKEKLDKKALKNIIESAILYSLDFDLLVPPYETVKVLTVGQIHETRIQSQLQTGKRLGFTFRTDDVHGETAYTGK